LSDPRKDESNPRIHESCPILLDFPRPVDSDKPAAQIGRQASAGHRSTVIGLRFHDKLTVPGDRFHDDVTLPDNGFHDYVRVPEPMVSRAEDWSDLSQ
jgi:hypothetical protein